jgi:hypothetical protein
MADGAQPGVTASPVVSGKGRRNREGSQSEKDNNAKQPGSRRMAKGKRTIGQIGRSPYLKFAKLGREKLAPESGGERRMPKTERDLPIVIRFYDFKPPFREIGNVMS